MIVVLWNGQEYEVATCSDFADDGPLAPSDGNLSFGTPPGAAFEANPDVATFTLLHCTGMTEGSIEGSDMARCTAAFRRYASDDDLFQGDFEFYRGEGVSGQADVTQDEFVGELVTTGTYRPLGEPEEVRDMEFVFATDLCPDP